MYKNPRFVLIGNPENRRASFFQQALQQAGQGPALVISYLDILDKADLLNKLTGNLQADDIIVRIESPGENFEVEKRILALGGLEGALDLEEQRGRIYHPRLWFKGFTRLMASFAQHFEHDWQGGQGGQLSWFNHPADILDMFDKPACKHILQPYTLPGFPVFSCYEEFFSFVKEQQYSRFFIKLNSSSSASGVVAYEYNKTNNRELAYSTVEVVSGMDGDRYFNSLKVKKYTSAAMISNVLDFLFGQGALVERWVPKARHGDSSYDLRVMGIGGERRHAIARLSRGPMTNLHLGNQRCAVDELELSSSTWADIDTLVAKSMQAFPRSLYAGLDVLIPRNGGLPVLLEANAFGDLLPNLLHNEESTYLAEINAVLKRREEAYAGH